MKKAVALCEGNNDFEVVARGEGDIAHQIVTAAREYGIKIVENKYMVDVLSEFRIGDRIPESIFRLIYSAVAFFESVLV